MSEHPALSDVSDCEREPIHVPGSIQEHGLLVALRDSDFAVVQISENCRSLLGVEPTAVLEGSLKRLLPAEWHDRLFEDLLRAPTRGRPKLLRTVTFKPPLAFHALAHRSDGCTILEFELADQAVDPSLDPAACDPHAAVDEYTLRAEAANDLETLSRIACADVRRLTGFDRVLVYRFDESWHGTVIGEDRNDRLPAYLHHRFPASDIPAQARELYRVNRVRIIPNVHYRPVALTPTLNPITGLPLDLTFATLRSVSPVHLEYMRNMGTASSMSVSIVRDGRLWGLIACHHQQPHHVPFLVRGTCDLIARAFSLRLTALERSHDYERRLAIRTAFVQLVAILADRSDFAAALSEHAGLLISYAGAEGAAVLTDGGCVRLGRTPSEEDVRGLAYWLFRTVQADVFDTDELGEKYPPAAAYPDIAAGLLAVAISKVHPSYILWFRPEYVRTIQWGGDPAKSVSSTDGAARLHPRRSFETWQEIVRGRSRPWSPSEIEGVAELRNALVGIVLRRAEELAGLNAELTRSNRELESFSYSVSHDLRAPLRHIVGYAEMLREPSAGTLTAQGERCVKTIIESSEFAGNLVDKLLAFSRMGRAELQLSSVDMTALAEETCREVMATVRDRRITWHIVPLPGVQADLMMLRLAVRNLFDNAVKYTRAREEAVIEVGSRETETEYEFWVRDNGVGFDQQYAGKLFGVFQRLHRMEDYEGTGIGLANVRRVMERHGGRTWAEGKENGGATIHFTLPKVPAAFDPEGR